MFYSSREPSLAETLSDPMIQAMMAADAVDPEALDALLREVAHRFEPRLASPAIDGRTIAPAQCF